MAYGADFTDTQNTSRILAGIRLYFVLLLGVLLLLYLMFWDDVVRELTNTWQFGLVGILGAIIASATGTGGGVVFVPVFDAFRGAVATNTIQSSIILDQKNIIAISFLIQCYGMSIGSLTWLYKFYGGGVAHADHKISGHVFLTIVFTILVTTIPSLLITQIAFFNQVDGSVIQKAFKWFSVIVGISLLVFTWVYKRVRPNRRELDLTDIYMLLAIGLAGGAITAFFSVGVGELVAVYLIFRKFPAESAIAAAVVISAITVIVGIWNQLDNVIWSIALIAVPGAMIGGIVARKIAEALGALYLKTLAAIWITGSSLYLLVGSIAGVMPN